MTLQIVPRIIIPGTFQHIHLSASSPWGPIQNSEILLWATTQDGSAIPVLWQVHTAGHGGTRVHHQLAAAYFETLPADFYSYGGSPLWYEEDCESCVPLYIFYNGLTPDCWLIRNGPYPRAELLQSLQRYLPDAIPALQDIAQRFDEALTAAGITLRTPVEPLEGAAQEPLTASSTKKGPHHDE